MTVSPELCSDGDLVIGIDLGTTNSLAAVMSQNGPRVVPTADGALLIPSVVGFEADGSRIYGEAAKARALDLPDRTVHSVKRLIGRSGEDVATEASRLPYRVELGARGLPRIAIDDQSLSPEEISADILRYVRDTVENAIGRKVSAAVITVPAYFDDSQRQATRDAAELAELECLRIVNEPTAASLAYGIDGSKDGTVLVYDLGGGTFDVSILKIKDGVFRVLATAGDTHLGGDDFDALLVDRILETIGTSAGDVTDSYVRQAIRRSAQGLKHQLSASESASLTVDVGGEPRELTITRAEFEAAIAPFVERTLECCRRALSDAGVAIQELDDVVLVGGSTRVPAVAAAVQEMTGREPAAGVDPDQAVALGAALQADVLTGGNRSLLLLDVVPLSLGIETIGGLISKLILRNATIPTSATEEFSTSIDNQTAVDINVYQGEREQVDHCRRLGAFKLRGIPPMPAGLPRIAVTFLIDADGVLRVTAKEQRTGVEASIQVVPSFGLTRDEVRDIMQASIDHAMDDMVAREDVELRTKATAMVEGTTKALAMAELPPDQTFAVKQSVKALRKLVEAEAPLDQVRGAIDDLSARTGQIADDVISSAVTKALRNDGQETPAP